MSGNNQRPLRRVTVFWSQTARNKLYIDTTYVEVNVADQYPEEWVADEVTVNGVRLRYVRTGGTGHPLIVAHGFYDDGPSRLPLISELAAEFDVIAYDARGHGRSEAPATGYSVEDRIDDLIGFLNELSLESPILLGHSTGGNTALAAGARQPQRSHAIVAVDPAGLLDIEPDPDVRERHTRERIEEWNRYSADELLTVDETLQKHVSEGNKRLARLLARARQRVHPHAAAITRHGFANPEEIYPKIDVPTLILRADGSEEQRARDRNRCALLPDGSLVHIDGAGHTVIRDAREEATRAILEFLEARS